MWEEFHDRLALLELLSTGRLPKRRVQRAAWDWLSSLDWTRVSTRRDERLLDERHRAQVSALLDKVWPEWPEVERALAEMGLPPTPKGYGALIDAARAARLGELPERLNRRTALASVAPHSKALLTAERVAALGDVEVTRDGSVRMRPPPGLRLRRGDRVLDAALVSELLGEVAISERAFLDGLEIEGAIEALLTVENLGAYQDLAAPPGWLVAYVAGWDTATATHLVRRLAAVPALHFGDLDPNGVRIVRHLRAIRPDLGWFVPELWAEHVPARAQRGAWPPDLDLGDAPPLVLDLARRGLWLEQEAIILDPRIVRALASTLTGDR